jgi:hypothetical protein
VADPITCSAGCKREQRDADAATAAGWDVLPITGRWRCPACTRELLAINARYLEMPASRDAAPAR